MGRRSLAGRSVVACLCLAGLAGCGGGRSGPAGGGGSSLPQPSFSGSGRGTGTARFQVDLARGTIEVTPLSGTAGSRAAFGGSAVTFTSQLVLDQAGNTGLRQVNVSLTNHWGIPIGIGPDGAASGLRVVFGPFTNLTGVPDVRALTTVSTVPGAVPSPFGVAVGSDGAVFASSASANNLLQFSAGTVTQLAGSGTAGFADGLGAGAAFAYPLGLAVNPGDSAIYLADYNGRRVRRIERSGKVTTVAGTGAAGTADGLGNAATFTNPFAVAAATNGDVFVSDWGAGAVRRLHLTGYDPALAANWAVSTLVTGLAGPAGVAAGGDGMVYVAEANANRIRQVTPPGAWTVIAGGGPEGNADGYGNTAPWAIPYGLAWTPDGLVASEYHTHRLRWLRPMGTGAPSDPASWQVLTVAGDIFATGTADGDGTSARFSSPRLLAADVGGAVYLADSGNNCLRKLILPSAAGLPGAPSGPGSTEAVTLSNATGVLSGPDVGGSRPYLDYPAGAGGLAPGRSTAAQPWQFLVPSGVTAFAFTVTVEGPASTLAPPEAASGQGSSRALVATLAGVPGTLGNVEGPAPTARFSDDLSVAADSLGDVFIGDSLYHVIRRLGRDGLVTTVAGGSGPGHADGQGGTATFNRPRGLAVNPAGTVLYVSDWANHTIRRVSLTGSDPRLPSSWTVSTIAGSPTVLGYVNGQGNVARFNAPSGVCRVSDALLYLCEQYGCRVRRLRLTGPNPDAASDWDVGFVAGDTNSAAGAVGTTDGVGPSARFNAPLGLAAGRDGALYLADTQNHRIRKVLPDGTVTTYAGPSGASTPSGNTDGAAGSALFTFPMGVATDAGGELYVADYGFGRIRRVSSSAQVTTVAGGGSGPWDGPGNAARFPGPVAVAVDAAGTIYVGDAGAVRKIERLIDAGA